LYANKKTGYTLIEFIEVSTRSGYMTSEKRAVIKIFCSYSDEDRSFQENLEKHLTSLVREGSAVFWDKHKVTAGQEHRREIDSQLKEARIILLLISKNFISSDDCYGVDLAKALRRYKDDRIRVIPILLQPCTWDELAFSQFQVLPSNRVPVSLWRNRDAAFNHIVEEIKKVIQEIHQYGDGYFEPLQPKLVSSVSNAINPTTQTHQRTRTPRQRNATAQHRGTRNGRQRNTLRAEATRPANTRYLQVMPQDHPISLGSTIKKFLAFFHDNISGYAFNRRYLL
jgi:hypothetical protein